MKKLFILILVLMIFCGCSVIGEQPAENKEVTIFKSEEGLYGLSCGEEIIHEAVFDAIETAKDDDKLFYSYKAFVYGETEFFLEEGGEHLFKVSERPAEYFYLLDEEGKHIIDVAFTQIGISYIYDGNNNLLPSFLYGVSKGSYYGYDFSGGKPVLTEFVGTEDAEADFGYKITTYSYEPYNFTKCGVKLGEKVIVENVADRIEIPFEDRILFYYGPTWQAFNCGKCLILDEEGKVLSDKFNRVEFVTFENGTYAGIGFTAGDRAEEPTFDENGERMPGGVWIIDKDGNILSENLFDTENFMGYYNIDGYSLNMISHDDNGKETIFEIPLEDYMGEVNDSMGYDLYAAVTNAEIVEGKYIPKADVLPKKIIWADEEHKKYCEELIDGIDIGFAGAFIVGTTPDENGARVGISKGQADELLKILKEAELVISEPTNPNTPAVTEIHIAMQSGEYIKIVWDTSYFTLYEKGAEAAYRFDASEMKESFIKFSNLYNELFIRGAGTGAQYPNN